MEDPTLAEYRRVSVLAILALLLGLASSGALLGEVLLALPVVGLGVGLLAIAKINASDKHFSGRLLAQWGIFFSVLFGVAAVARPLLFQEIVDRQAQSFARDWLELLVAGNVKQALKVVDMSAKSPMVPRNTRGKPAANDDIDIEAKILEVFRQDPIVGQLQTAGKQARVRYEQTVSKPISTGRQTWVTQIFSITGKQSDGENPTDQQNSFHVRLHLQKTRTTGNRVAFWSVLKWQLTDG
jgi:hypothetical protein